MGSAYGRTGGPVWASLRVSLDSRLKLAGMTSGETGMTNGKRDNKREMG